ncbi:hypothetical protein [Sediminibacterium sp. TEGAF015]|uniref:hypothetical protein n=1 Tax=Sediminibacterium sp. TEGAF015 TaxID=575378 RepID=UPI002231E915|nr:hypothetical protein [Sediminibacterium sp. TEGAF015]
MNRLFIFFVLNDDLGEVAVHRLFKTAKYIIYSNPFSLQRALLRFSRKIAILILQLPL